MCTEGKNLGKVTNFAKDLSKGANGVERFWGPVAVLEETQEGVFLIVGI